MNEALRMIKMSKVNDIVSFCTTVDALNSRDVSLYTVTFSQVSLEDCERPIETRFHGELWAKSCALLWTTRALPKEKTGHRLDDSKPKAPVQEK